MFLPLKFGEQYACAPASQLSQIKSRGRREGCDWGDQSLHRACFVEATINIPPSDAAPLSADAGPEDVRRAVEAAKHEGHRVIVTRGGKPVAALVPLDDLQALEALEDARDAEAVRKGLEAYEREGHTWPALEQVAARYGIKL